MNNVHTANELPMLKHMSKRRLIKKFRKYTNELDMDIHAQNINALEQLQAVVSFTCKYRAGMKPKQSKIASQITLCVFMEIIKGRFNSPNDHAHSEFFREWTKNCRGEKWFEYCNRNLAKGADYFKNETVVKCIKQ